MNLKFNPKEAFASIVNTFAASMILSNGGGPELSAAAGAALEGAIKGIEYKRERGNRIHSLMISLRC